AHATGRYECAGSNHSRRKQTIFLGGLTAGGRARALPRQLDSGIGHDHYQPEKGELMKRIFLLITILLAGVLGISAQVTYKFKTVDFPGSSFNRAHNI